MTKPIVAIRNFANALENERWRLEVLVMQFSSNTNEYIFVLNTTQKGATSKQPFLMLSSYLMCFPGNGNTQLNSRRERVLACSANLNHSNVNAN